MNYSTFEISDMNGKRLKTGLSLIANKLTSKGIMDVYPIAFSHSLNKSFASLITTSISQ